MLFHLHGFLFIEIIKLEGNRKKVQSLKSWTEQKLFYTKETLDNTMEQTKAYTVISVRQLNSLNPGGQDWLIEVVKSEACHMIWAEQLKLAASTHLQEPFHLLFFHFIRVRVSLYLNGVESQLYHRTLLGCERLGLLTDHVLLRATTTKRSTDQSEQPFINPAPYFLRDWSPEPSGVFTYRTFSLDSCPSSLAALKMSWVPWKRRRQRKVDRQRERRVVVVIIMTKRGQQ